MLANLLPRSAFTKNVSGLKTILASASAWIDIDQH
jgi:hypothetical protein